MRLRQEGVHHRSRPLADHQRESCPPDGTMEVLGHVNERYGRIEPYVRITGLNLGQLESIRAAFVE